VARDSEIMTNGQRPKGGYAARQSRVQLTSELQRPQFAPARLLAAYASVSAAIFGGAAFASASQPLR
jgi:hypothetical protein